MPFSANTATSLVGKSRINYQCNHVVNEVHYGNKSIGGKAIDYLNYGTQVLFPSAGTVVVGTDGVYVGIFISDTKFIHSSSTRHMIIEADLSQLKYTFLKGYIFRKK